MNPETILIILISTLPLTATLSYLAVKRGVYWINGQTIIPAPNQQVNIVNLNEYTNSQTGLVGRYTKVLSFFGSLRLDPNFNFINLLKEEYAVIESKTYKQRRFSLDLVDLKYINSTAINDIIQFLYSCHNESIEIQIIFPNNKFEEIHSNFLKLFSAINFIKIKKAAKHVCE